jgi:hypothetical protein
MPRSAVAYISHEWTKAVETFNKTKQQLSIKEKGSLKHAFAVGVSVSQGLHELDTLVRNRCVLQAKADRKERRLAQNANKKRKTNRKEALDEAAQAIMAAQANDQVSADELDSQLGAAKAEVNAAHNKIQEDAQVTLTEAKRRQHEDNMRMKVVHLRLLSLDVQHACKYKTTGGTIILCVVRADDDRSAVLANGQAGHLFSPCPLHCLTLCLVALSLSLREYISLA